MSIKLRIGEVVAEYMLALQTPQMYDFEFGLAKKAIENLPSADIVVLSDRDQWDEFQYRYDDMFDIQENWDLYKIILKNSDFNSLQKRCLPWWLSADLQNLIQNALTSKGFIQQVERKKLEEKENIDRLEIRVEKNYAFELSRKEQQLKELHREVRRLRTYVGKQGASRTR
jgi:hypothetical protein